jgi:hypothetical protein
MEAEARTRYDRRPLIVAAAVVLALGAVGSIDYQLTADQVPDVPAPCEPVSQECEAQRSQQFEDRLNRAIELENDLEVRAWVYAAVAFLAALAGAAATLRRNPPDRHREVFTDLGVGSVLWLLAGFALGLLTSHDLIDAPSKPVFYPAIALAVIAGAGTFFTRRSPAEDAADRDPTAGPAVRWFGYGATVAAVALAWIGASTRPDPCTETGADQGIEALVGLSLLAAVIAVVFGLASLFQRRWIGALVMLLVGPFAALLALFTGVCWN